MLSPFFFETAETRSRNELPISKAQELENFITAQAFKEGPDRSSKFRELLRITDSIHPTRLMSSSAVYVTCMRAIEKTRIDIISDLLAEGMDVNFTFRGRSMLHEAARLGNDKVLRYLLNLRGINKNCVSAEERTLVAETLFSGKAGCLKILLESNCGQYDDGDDDLPRGMSRFHLPFLLKKRITPEFAACLDVLLDHGEDINGKNSENKTILQKAIEFGNHSLICWLLFNNCDLRQKWVAVSTGGQKQGEPLHCTLKNKFGITLSPTGTSPIWTEDLSLGTYPYSSPLMAHCRWVIRNSLSSNIKWEVTQLGLPAMLQRYVLCLDELESINHSYLASASPDDGSKSLFFYITSNMYVY